MIFFLIFFLMIYIPEIHFTRLSYLSTFLLSVFLLSLYLLIFNITFFIFDPDTSISQTTDLQIKLNKTTNKKRRLPLNKTKLAIIKTVFFILSSALLAFNTYYFTRICETYLVINVSLIIAYLLFIIGHIALLPHQNRLVTSSFVTGIIFPISGFVWMSSFLHTQCLSLLNLGLLVSSISYYKQLAVFWIILGLLAWVFIAWSLSEEEGSRYKLLKLFLSKQPRSAKNINEGSYEIDSNDTHKMLKSALLTEKYRSNVSKLRIKPNFGIKTGYDDFENNEDNPSFDLNQTSESIKNNTNYVKTREDVLFHLFLAMNCLFWGKMLTSWIQMDLFGYLVENNISLWVNLGTIILFLFAVLFQLFQVKKHRSKFTS